MRLIVNAVLMTVLFLRRQFHMSLVLLGPLWIYSLVNKEREIFLNLHIKSTYRTENPEIHD
jgi:hypothetical protein